MQAVDLERELALFLRFPIGESLLIALHRRHVLGNRRYLLEAEFFHLVHGGLAVDLQLARSRGPRVRLGIVSERLQGNEIEAVANGALDSEDAIALEIENRHATFLGLALNAQFGQVLFGDAHEILEVLAVLREDLRSGNHIYDQLLLAHRSQHIAIHADAVGQLKGDLGIALAFEQRLHYLAEPHDGLAIGGAEIAVALPGARNREHDIRILAIGGHDQVLGHHRIHHAIGLDALHGGRPLIEEVFLAVVDHVHVVVVGLAVQTDVLALIDNGGPHLVHVHLAVLERIGDALHIAERSVARIGVVHATLEQRLETTLHPGMAAVGSAAAAGLADEAGHGTESHEVLAELRAGSGTGQSRRRNDRSTLGAAQHQSQTLQVFGGRPADLRSPLGRLRHAIVGAKHVITVVLLRIGPLRQVVGIEADGAAVEEIPIDERIVLRIVLGEQHVSHSEEGGAVGTRANGDVVVGEHFGRGRIERVDTDELHARLFALKVIIGGEARAAPGRIGTPQHDDLARAQIDAVVGFLGKADELGHLGPGARRHRAGLLEAAAFNIHHAADVVIAEALGHAARQKNALVAVGVDDAQDLTRNEVESLVPADALPFVASAQLAVGVLTAARLPVLALHGVLDAIGAEDHAAQGATTSARAQLGAVRRVVMGLVGAQAHHFPIAYESLVKALGAAVGPTAAGNPLPFRLDVLATGLT